MQPDAIIIQDPTLLHSVDVFSGSNPDGYLLINTMKTFSDLGLGEYVAGRAPSRNLIVPASDIALRNVGKALPNAALLGGFAAATKVVTIASVLQAITDRFPAKIAAGNVAAAQEAYDFVLAELEELDHAKAN
jgi:pyruvate ferredoxin oxidoreductase gamma subunit